MARKELVILIKAVDQISAPIRNTMGAIGRLGRTAIDTTGRVLRSMGGLAKSVLNLKTLLGGLGVALAGGAILRSFASVSAAIDRTAKSARALGIAVEDYSKLEFVSDRAGISAEQLATAIRTAQRNVAQFVRGEGGQAARAFKDIDVSLTDANGRVKQGTDLLRAILVPLSKIPDEAVKTQKLTDIFGRAGAQMKNLSEGFEGVLAEAERLGFITANQAKIAEGFQDSITNLSRAWLIFKANVLEAIGPVLEDMVNRSARNLAKFGKLVGDALLTVRAAFGDGKVAAQARVALLQVYDNVMDGASILIDTGARTLGIMIFAATKAANEGTGKIIQMDLGRELALGVTGALVELDNAMEKLGDLRSAVFPKLSPVVKGAREIMVDVSKHAIASGATISDVAGSVATNVSRIIPAVNQELARLRDRLLELAPKFDKTGILVRTVADSMRQLGIEAEGSGDKTEKAAFKIADILPSVWLGIKGAAEAARISSLQFVKLGEDVFNVLGNQISGALTNLATGTAKAKDAFRDMAKGIIDDLTRLTIRMAIFNALSGIFAPKVVDPNGFQGGYEGVGRLLNTQSGPLPVSTGGLIRSGGHVRRFASGGVVPGPNINRDMVPALLAPGEGVVNRRGMRNLGEDRLHAINRGEGGAGVSVSMENHFHFHGGFTPSMAT